MPAENPEWATDATVASGPEATLPTKVTPSDGLRQQGFQADQALAARLLNGQLNIVGRWITYLSKACGLLLTDTARELYPSISQISALNYLPSDQAWYLTGAQGNLGTDPNTLQPVVYQAKADVQFVLPLDLPPDSILTRVDITVKGDDTHMTVLPNTSLPEISLLAVTDDGTVEVLEGPVVDPSTTLVQYKAPHTLAIEPVGGVDAGTGGGTARRRLYLHIKGEHDSSLSAATLFFVPRAYVKAKP